MNLTIHRGTHEIGGTCIELSTNSTRIILDFGVPLTDRLGEEFNEATLKGRSTDELKEMGILYDIKGLYQNDKPNIDAILISHSHRDHYGFLKYAHPDIPVYISDGALKLIHALNLFARPENKFNISKHKIVEDKHVFDIGDFKIKPYLVDHSGFDAMSYHIIDKTSGKSIFYSGDFRSTGWKGELFDRFIANPPKDVSYLLMEGTMIEREDGAYPDEKAVLSKLAKVLEASKNMVTLAYASAQNIDRMVTFYKAVRQSKALFVIDPYTAYILHTVQTKRNTLPQAGWPNIRVLVADYYGKREGDLYMNKIGSSDKEFLKKVGGSKIHVSDLSKLDRKALVLMRNTMIPVIRRIRGLSGSTIVYSQWDGYLKKSLKENKKFTGFVEKFDLKVNHIHTGGHANIETLKAFAKAVVPEGKIVPIHTASPRKFMEYFKDQVLLLDNGQPLEI